MKLAVLAVLTLGLGLAGVASADDRLPEDPYGPPAPAMRQQRQQRPLKRLLLAKFDRNHDGRLEPRERKRAAKALHKLANRLAQADGRQQRRQKFIRRFDLNHDGNVGPGEMPPALADQLRPLDQDGDGWLEGNELP
jgi:hypothetical protein